MGEAEPTNSRRQGQPFRTAPRGWFQRPFSRARPGTGPARPRRRGKMGRAAHLGLHFSGKRVPSPPSLVAGAVAQLVEHYVRNVGVEGSNPFCSTRFQDRFPLGGVAKWPTASDCKSDDSVFEGSNPSPTTTLAPLKTGGFFVSARQEGNPGGVLARDVDERDAVSGRFGGFPACFRHPGLFRSGSFLRHFSFAAEAPRAV